MSGFTRSNVNRRRRMNKGREGDNGHRKRVPPIRDTQA